MFSPALLGKHLWEIVFLYILVTWCHCACVGLNLKNYTWPLAPLWVHSLALHQSQPISIWHRSYTTNQIIQICVHAVPLGRCRHRRVGVPKLVKTARIGILCAGICTVYTHFHKNKTIIIIIFQSITLSPHLRCPWLTPSCLTDMLVFWNMSSSFFSPHFVLSISLAEVNLDSRRSVPILLILAAVEASIFLQSLLQWRIVWLLHCEGSWWYPCCCCFSSLQLSQCFCHQLLFIFFYFPRTLHWLCPLVV